ncbi:MAG: anthranilate phosphoribosyltransferase, partial [Bacteroidaceae bacterium]
AGAGYKVAKHGNYATTSISGASNVIASYGIHFTTDADLLQRSLEQAGIAYLHAPLFANGMKVVAPIRKALGIPTCFNLLGPLINPSRPAYQLLGVANLAQMRLYTNALQKTDVNYGIVTSVDGYDEISLTSGFKVMTRHLEKVLLPQDISLKSNSYEELFGGKTTADAVKIFSQVLNGEATESQKNVVLINATFGIQLMEPKNEIQECLAIARESLESGLAMQTFKKFIEINS